MKTASDPSPGLLFEEPEGGISFVRADWGRICASKCSLYSHPRASDPKVK